MKGILFSVLLTGFIVFVMWELSPQDEKCAKWEVAVKRTVDPKSKLMLTVEVPMCVRKD